MYGRVLELESERLIKKGRAEGEAKGRAILIKAVIALRNGASEADLKAQGIDDETINQAMIIK